MFGALNPKPSHRVAGPTFRGGFIPCAVGGVTISGAKSYQQFRVSGLQGLRLRV